MAKTSTNNSNYYHSSSSSSSPTESLGVCEKLFTAIKASPAIQTIRRVSLLRPRSPTPPPPPVQNRHFTPKTIPILHGGGAHGNKAVAIESTVDKKPEVRIDRGDDYHDRLNQACSEFISRAGAKIRTTVSDDHLGDRGGDGAANQSTVAMKKKESFKDQLVSDYISRAKVKIRSPSSAKEMISLSFKTDE